VNQDGSIGLTFIAKMTTNRKMKTYRIFINRKGLNKVVDSLIGVVREQKLQPILDGFFVCNLCLSLVAALTQTPNKPANGNCNR
jgi:hypothetical protein